MGVQSNINEHRQIFTQQEIYLAGAIIPQTKGLRSKRQNSTQIFQAIESYQRKLVNASI